MSKCNYTEPNPDVLPCLWPEQEKALREEVQQEQHQGTLLQHSLDDKLAQLRLEEVAVQVRSSTNQRQPALL